MLLVALAAVARSAGMGTEMMSARKQRREAQVGRGGVSQCVHTHT